MFDNDPIHYEKDGLSFMLNQREYTAALISGIKAQGNVFIPATINYDNQEYTVTFIANKVFTNNMAIESIKFAEDSKIRILFVNSFEKCNISQIYLPPSIKKFSYGHIGYLPNLQKIIISPNNKYFKYVDTNHDLIATKSTIRANDSFGSLILENHDFNDDESDDNFDTLIFVNRSIEKVIIPSTIKIIDSFAFYHCFRLKSIEYEDLYSVTTINPAGFCQCSLDKILIPPNVKTIKPRTFANCPNLNEVCFTDDSNLEMIEQDALMDTHFKKFTFPPKIKKLSIEWCKDYALLDEIEISEKNHNFAYLKGYQKKVVISKSDEKSDIFDVLFFVSRTLKSIVIPSFIKKIGSYSFSNCSYLNKIEFEPNSQLVHIDNGAFYLCRIKKISIPNCVEIIGSNAFYMCLQLTEADVSNCVNLNAINNHAFYRCSIKNFVIPRKVKSVGAHAFSNTSALYSIEFLGDSMSLGDHCFCNCNNLTIISLPNAEKIKSISSCFINVSKDFVLFTIPKAMM